MGMNMVVVTQDGVPLDDGMAIDLAIFSNGDMGTDDRIGSDMGACWAVNRFVNDCGGVNRHG